MQETRQQILEILRELGQATVDDLVNELRDLRGDKITAVTVRHHLNELQRRELIITPQLLHRSSPGRPQHVYALTDKAAEHFPDNYRRLAAGLLNQLQSQLPPESINVILEGVADEMAAEAGIRSKSLKARLSEVVAYLNEHGYNAMYEETPEGFLLHTRNCPYHHLAQETDSLCSMDMRLISAMLGVVPRMQSRVAEGATSCTYLIPHKDGA